MENPVSDDFIIRTGAMPVLYRQMALKERDAFHDSILSKIVNMQQGRLDPKVTKAIVNISKFIDPSVSDSPKKGVDINGVRVSAIPTKVHRLPRLFSCGLGTEYNSHVERCLESFQVKGVTYLIGFVNPEELSYHNLENILLMDYYMKKISVESIYVLESPSKDSRLDVHRGTLGKCECLVNLDKEGLYIPPMNRDERGGKRFIFKSILLAKQLTHLVKDMDLDIPEMSVFRHVNPVFRLNSFPYTDTFSKHYDTPYFDKSRKHVSLYTLIIYLCKGRSYHRRPVLHVEDDSKYFNLYQVSVGSFVIFNQEYEHQGNPIADGNKIFLRTELVFDYSGMSVDDNDNLARVFSSSCYMMMSAMKQSPFMDQYKKYATEYFNIANKCRFNLIKDVGKNMIHAIKEMCFTSHSFLEEPTSRKINEIYMSNGTDYYFSVNESDVSDYIDNKNNKKVEHLVKYLTMLLLIDYFNPQCMSKININTVELVRGANSQEELCAEFDKVVQLRYTKREVDLIYWHDYNVSLQAKEGISCVECDYRKCERNDREELIEKIKKLRVENPNEATKFSVVIFDRVKINMDDMHVGLNTISFSETGMTKEVNFASCRCGCHDVKFEQEKTEGVGFKIPTIKYHFMDNCVHMTFDMYSNGFYIKKPCTLNHCVAVDPESGEKLYFGSDVEESENNKSSGDESDSGSGSVLSSESGSRSSSSGSSGPSSESEESEESEEPGEFSELSIAERLNDLCATTSEDEEEEDEETEAEED